MPILNFTRVNVPQWLTGRLTWLRSARDMGELHRVFEAGRNDLSDLLEAGLISAEEKDRLARLLRNAALYRADEHLERQEVAA